MQVVLWSLDPRGGKIKLKSFRIAVDEIKDSVPASIQSCDQVRPRHRALRRDAGSQTPERSLLGQPREIRHLALGHELGEQVRIEPVDAQDDQLPRPRRSAPPVLAGEKQAQTRGAQCQQAHQPKTFSEELGHYKYEMQARSAKLGLQNMVCKI